MPKILDKGEVIVTMTGEESRAAIEHAAWCAVVDNDPSIAVSGSRVVPWGDGHKVIYTRKE